MCVPLGLGSASGSRGYPLDTHTLWTHPYTPAHSFDTHTHTPWTHPHGHPHLPPRSTTGRYTSYCNAFLSYVIWPTFIALTVELCSYQRKMVFWDSHSFQMDEAGFRVLHHRFVTMCIWQVQSIGSKLCMSLQSAVSCKHNGHTGAFANISNVGISDIFVFQFKSTLFSAYLTYQFN